MNRSVYPSPWQTKCWQNIPTRSVSEGHKALPSFLTHLLTCLSSLRRPRQHAERSYFMYDQCHSESPPQLQRCPLAITAMRQPRKNKTKQEPSDFRKGSFWFTCPAAFSTDLQSCCTEMQIQVSCRLSGELRCHSEMCWFMSWINNKNKRRWVDLIYRVLPYNSDTCTPCTSEGNIVLFTPLQLFTPSKIQCYRLNLQAAYKLVNYSGRMLVTH